MLPAVRRGFWTKIGDSAASGAGGSPGVLDQNSTGVQCAIWPQGWVFKGFGPKICHLQKNTAENLLMDMYEKTALIIYWLENLEIH